MEKQLIEQLISNGLSIKKIKSIVEKLEGDDKPDHDLNKTTIANTCGLRLIKCGSCNKKFYEDKFMLNRLNKRYRSCIDCVMRQRTYRQKDQMTNPGKHARNDSANETKLFAILDKDYNDIDDEDEASPAETDDNATNVIYPIQKKENIVIEPKTDKPKQTKSKKTIHNNHIFSLFTEPEIEPEEVGLRIFNLFN